MAKERIKKKITIEYEPDSQLGERLERSAGRNKRSKNKQILYFLEEGLLTDEKYYALSDDQKLIVIKIVKETIEKLN